MASIITSSFTVITTVVVVTPTPTAPLPSSQPGFPSTQTFFPTQSSGIFSSGIFGSNSAGQTVTLTITRYLPGGQNSPNITTPIPIPVATPITTTSTATGSFIPFNTAVPTARSVVVDDSDPTIQYTGDWTIVNDTTPFDDTNSGMPFQGTLHSLANGTGSIEFAVNGGSAGQILGATVASNFTAGNQLSWTCIIDGKVVAFNATTPTETQSYWPICQWNNMTSTTHSITLNATSQGTPFYFDRMSYVPAAGSTFTNESIVVPCSDSKIVYDQTWFAYTSSMMTRTNGATWSFTFEGASVEWYGLVPAQLSKSPSIATYSVDNGTPVTFALSALPLGASNQSNQIHFKTPTLSPGAHVLSVNFLGNTDTAPLNLESLIVYNGPTIAETNTPGASSDLSRPSTKVQVGPIAGGLVGGVAVIVIIVATIWYFLRRARQNNEDAESVEIDDLDEPSSAIRPFSLEMKHVLNPTPFTSSGDRETLIVHSARRKSQHIGQQKPPGLQRHLQLQNRSPVSITDYSSSSTLNLDAARAVLHMDSDIRLPEDFPPSYTVH